MKTINWMDRSVKQRDMKPDQWYCYHHSHMPGGLRFRQCDRLIDGVLYSVRLADQSSLPPQYRLWASDDRPKSGERRCLYESFWHTWTMASNEMDILVREFDEWMMEAML